jgi:hypothetical protein
VPDDIVEEYIDQKQFPPDDKLLQLFTIWAATGLKFRDDVDDETIQAKEINNFLGHCLTVKLQEDKNMLKLVDLWDQAYRSVDGNASDRTRKRQRIGFVRNDGVNGFHAIVPSPNYEPFITRGTSRHDGSFYQRKLNELNIMTEHFPNTGNNMPSNSPRYMPMKTHVSFYYYASSLIAYQIAIGKSLAPLHDAFTGRKATFKYKTANGALKDAMIQVFNDQKIMYNTLAILINYGEDITSPEEHFTKTCGLGNWSNQQVLKTKRGLYTVSQTECSHKPSEYMLVEHYLFLKSCSFYQEAELIQGAFLDWPSW